MPRLVLSRKLDQKIIIHKQGDIIAVVTYAKSSTTGKDDVHNSIKLLFEAEDNIDIDRLEIFRQKYRSQK